MLSSVGQTGDRAVVREEFMVPSPPKLFTLGRMACRSMPCYNAENVSVINVVLHRSSEPVG